MQPPKAFALGAAQEREARPRTLYGLTPVEGALRLVSLGFRNSFRRPARTSLSILGVALCVVLMLTVTAVSHRYTTVVGQSYSLYSSDLVVVSRASLLVEGIPIGGSIPQQAVGLVEGVRGVASATPMLLVVEVKELVPSNVTIGVPIGNFSMFAQINTIALRGSYPSAPDQVVVGGNVARQGGLGVGSNITEDGTTLTVSGVMSTSNLILSNAVVMPLATAQATQGYVGLVSAILVDSQPGWGGNLTQDIDAAIPGVSAVNPSESEQLTSTLVSSVSSINDAIDFFSLALAAMLVSIIASVGVMEKKDEFATMWAMGGSTSSVMKVALAETGLFAAVGFAVGLGLSVVATSLVFQVYASVPFSASVSGIWALIPPQAVALAGAVVVGFGVLVGAATASSLSRGVD